MINLLSTNRKAELRAARTNVFLMRYIGIVILAIIFIVGILYMAYTTLQQTETTANNRIELSSTGASSGEGASNSLSARLNEVNTVINQGVSYATILTKIGAAMPTGTVLESLKLDTAATTGTPLTLIAYAQTDEDAVAIQQNLQGTALFQQITPSGTSSTEGIPSYPIKVTLTVTLNASSL
jgi:Tfp pilus assembly protein PilN